MKKLILVIAAGALISGAIFIAPQREIRIEVTNAEAEKEIPAVLRRIANCESNDRQFDDSGEVIRGKINPLDIGRYQINLKYHEAKAKEMGLDLFNEKDNEEYALFLFETEGTTPWNWSRECWNVVQ